MPIRLTIVSDLFLDDPNQEVSVRDHLPIHTLIAETLREFRLPEGEYTLRDKATGRPLDSRQTLEEMGIQTGAVLLFGSEARPNGTPTGRAYLQAPSGETFTIRRQPALIGRPNPARGILSAMLDADLTALDTSKTTSRPHAQITEENGSYFVTSVRADNPVYLNNAPVPTGQPRPLRGGDQIRCGKVILTFSMR
ncbi:MAG TPA: FHA domain-containing protein [Aggregatilineaceae bacterium]|nr:FHA domain-containing protein [Aggregatilineaceae bacterium]